MSGSSELIAFGFQKDESSISVIVSYLFLILLQESTQNDIAGWHIEQITEMVKQILDLSQLVKESIQTNYAT